MRRIASVLLFVGAISVHATTEPDPCKPPNFPLPQFKAATFNVRDFGATGDGKTNDTPAINRAVEKCNSSGGGDVVFPAGTYSAASIHLKSNVHFLLDKDAVITGAGGGYDPPEPNPFDQHQDFGHSHFHNALMWGEKIENFAISGGRINGGHIIKDDPQGKDVGDKLISVVSGKNLLFQNVTHDSGGHFVYLLNDCENVTIHNVTIKQSRDAVNLVGCRNVQIHNCSFTGCGDDTIALKSDFALGRMINSENIYVWDSDLETSCNALQFGAETFGDFHNVNFWNIRINRAMKAAIGITSANGALIDGVTYRDITIKHAACPVFIRLINHRRSGDLVAKIGAIRNVKISNVSITECQATNSGIIRTSAILGQPDAPVENVVLENVKITGKGGAKWTDLTVKATDAKPQSDQPAKKTLPASGFYIRSAKDVIFKNVAFALETADVRPVLVASDVNGLTLDHFESQESAGGLLRLEKIRNFFVRHCAGLMDQRAEDVQALTK